MLYDFDSSRPTVVDAYPLALQELAKFPIHEFFPATETTEKTVAAITAFYQVGVDRFLAAQNLNPILPDERLWPEKYQLAYEWFVSVKYEVAGHLGLIAFELIKNAYMHGRGFMGAAAAWDGERFILQVADRGQGFGSSTVKDQGIALPIIGDFCTEAPRREVTPTGHVITLYRSLDKIRLPETDLITRARIREVQALIKAGQKLSELDPLSQTGMFYDATLGRYGGMRETDLLGRPTGNDTILTLEDIENNDN